MKTSQTLTLLFLTLASCLRAELVLSPGLTFVMEGGVLDAGNIANTGTAFAKDLIGGGAYAPTHTIPNVNNGSYGNGSSWIGDSAGSYVGIGFSSSQTIASFAFGRDNTNALLDRSAGTYTIQTTSDSDPAINHASVSWTTIGTLSIFSGTGVVASSAKRHQYNIDTPVNATGLRIIAPDGAAIDEIEIMTSASPTSVEPVTINTSPGFIVAWDGNDGDNFNAAGIVPDNLALPSNGAVAISSGDLGPLIFVPFHRAHNLNDGLYGNANSWIGDGAGPTLFAGVILPSVHEITSIAFGRDNGLDEANGDCCGGQLRDRSGGPYLIQRTLNGVAWQTVGTITFNYLQDDIPGGGFTPHLRHEFELGDESGGVDALGMRLVTPNADTAIDEIELTGTPGIDPDPDGDGYFSNVEIALGYDPNDSASNPEGNPDIELALEFSFYASARKSYRIESTIDQMTWNLVENNIAGTGGEIRRCYFQHPGDAIRSYRAVALP